IRGAADVPAALASARAETPGDEFLLQAFAPGQPASVTFLIGPKQCIALEPSAQQLSEDGRFHYLGGWLPLPFSTACRAGELGRHAVGTVPGLSGLVGVDMVLGE